ncbi:T9SS type A sorting domain-containing protein [uncultured Aquimarina sp.]
MAIAPEKVTINLPNYARGIYFLNVTMDNVSKAVKIVKN